MNFTCVPFPMSHVWNMFWTLVLAECTVDIHEKKTHQRALRENLFTFRMYIVSLPWSTSYPKSISLSIMNHFHIHWTLKLLFRLVIKNTFLRQQIWKTKACAQYLHSCKTFFFYNYEENLHQVRNRRLMKSLFVLLLFTVIKQTWGLKCCYSKRY